EVTKTSDDTDVCAGHETTYTYVVHNTSGVVESVTLVDDNETAGTGDDIDVTTCAAIAQGGPAHFTLQPDDHLAGGADQATYTCKKTLAVGSHTNVVTATGTFGTSTATDTDD